MTASPITVPEDASVESLLDDYVMGHHCSALPVITHNGTLLGLITIGRIRRLAPAERRGTRARDLAWALADVTTAAPDDLLLDVLRKPGTGGEGRVLVLSAGELVGIVSPTDVARAIQVSELARAA